MILISVTAVAGIGCIIAAFVMGADPRQIRNYAEGKTSVTEPALSRDHTERMLRSFGADIVSDGNTCTITPPETLHGQHIEVPGDISSAAFFIVAGLITPDSEITIKNVGINDTRAGILKVCQDMGADITLLHTREEGGEPVADLLVKIEALEAK